MTETFLEDVDGTWKEHGYNSRSEFVRDVLRDAVKHPDFSRADLKAMLAGEWDWELTDSVRRQFDKLDDYARDRLVSKLDEIVTDQWRDPTDHLEPLQGAPHQKLRIGQFRLGCRADRDAKSSTFLRI